MAGIKCFLGIVASVDARRDSDGFRVTYLDVDEAGQVIEKTAVDFRDRPLPEALRGRRG